MVPHNIHTRLTTPLHQDQPMQHCPDLTSGGTTVTGFAPATLVYNVELPAGTTVVPTVTATHYGCKCNQR